MAAMREASKVTDLHSAKSRFTELRLEVQCGGAGGMIVYDQEGFPLQHRRKAFWKVRGQVIERGRPSEFRGSRLAVSPCNQNARGEERIGCYKPVLPSGQFIFDDIDPRIRPSQLRSEEHTSEL